MEKEFEEITKEDLDRINEMTDEEAVGLLDNLFHAYINENGQIAPVGVALQKAIFAIQSEKL